LLRAPLRILADMRLALLVGRDLSPNRSWGIVLQGLIRQGHEVVAGAQALPAGQSGGVTAYEVFPRDIVTDYYLSIPTHEAAPGQLSSYFRQASYPETHAILMGMLSRRDSTGTFRTVDREVVLRRLQLALLSQLLRAKPTHMVFEETPHEVVDFALFRFAGWLGIPVLFFQPSLVGPQVVARSSLTAILEVECPLIGPKKLVADRNAVQAISQGAISKLQAGGGTAQLDRQKRVDGVSSRSRQKINVGKYLARRLGSTPSNRLVNLTGHLFLGERLRRSLEVLLEWSLRRSLHRTVAGLPSGPSTSNAKYALFALHYEPERTNMPEGLPYLAQLDAVLEARAFLPPDVTLLVKEHYSQQSASLRGYVGRSITAYDYLKSIPGVEVLGVSANSGELMRDAECVFTMTGKVGIEAAFAGTPAIYMGQPWWGEMPGSFDFSSLKNWKDLAEVRMPTEREVERWFEKQISSRLLVGLGGTMPEKYSSRVAPLPEGYEQLEAEAILSAIARF
jgi:hypothetical protein